MRKRTIPNKWYPLWHKGWESPLNTSLCDCERRNRKRITICESQHRGISHWAGIIAGTQNPTISTRIVQTGLTRLREICARLTRRECILAFQFGSATRSDGRVLRRDFSDIVLALYAPNQDAWVSIQLKKMLTRVFTRQDCKKWLFTVLWGAFGFS